MYKQLKIITTKETKTFVFLIPYDVSINILMWQSRI